MRTPGDTDRAGEDVALTVVTLLAGRGESLAVAESLTGGLVSGAVTAVPGSSAVLRGGVVAYAPAVKVAVLGVPAGLVEEVGTVHGDVALAMAEGVRALCGSDWGVATTGVAGPGPAEGHPAGTVHVAVVGESVRTTRALRLDGDRAEVRSRTVAAVLDLLRGTLD